MTTKLKSDVEEKVRELLGGLNPTAKRVEDLLEELAQRRIAAAAGQKFIAPEPAVDAAAEDLEPDGAEVVAEEEPVPVPFPATLSDLERQAALLEATRKQYEEKLADLARVQDPADVDRAVGAGKLPPPNTTAPPLGLRGFNSIPRGKWVKTPIGAPVFRSIDFIICDCEACSYT